LLTTWGGGANFEGLRGSQPKRQQTLLILYFMPFYFLCKYVVMCHLFCEKYFILCFKNVKLNKYSECVFCNFFENDEIKLKELKLKKKRKQIELQNAINEKKTFDFYNANLEKAKELMGKFV